MTFRDLIVARNHPDFYFVQVGANDGVKDDTLRPYILAHRWRGVLVEPLLDVFDKLKENYDRVEGLTFVNAAVVGEGTVDEKGEVEFLRHPRHSVCSGLEVRTPMQRRARMQRVVVRAVAMAELLSARIGVGLDLLQIDVEGHDADLVEMVPFKRLSPSIIRFEHKHLGFRGRMRVGTMLAERGYTLFPEGPDTVAYLPR